MKKRKPVSILKRSTTSNPNKKHKKSTHASSDEDHKKSKHSNKSTPSRPTPHPNKSKPSIQYIQPLSDIHRYASKAVERLLHADDTGKHGASLKSLTLAHNIPNKRAVYAVTIETLKYLPVLEEIVQRAGILVQSSHNSDNNTTNNTNTKNTNTKNNNNTRNINVSPATVYVLVRDLLFGDGLDNHSQGTAEQFILSHKTDLEHHVASLLQESNTDDVLDLLPAVKLGAVAAQRTKIVRVNELKMSVDEAMQWIDEHHHNTMSNNNRNNSSNNNNNSSNSGGKRRKKDRSANASIKWQYIDKNSITRDEHLPEVLHFPPQSDLHDHPLVQSGHWIIQSKASCMTARALDPEVNWKVIDACAAPGNKTTQLAAILHSSHSHKTNSNKNKKKGSVVIAFDKDNKRLDRLKENALLAGADSLIDARCADFLSIDPNNHEFSDIKAILLDPSCSGSGTVFSRMDYLLPSAIKKSFGHDSINYSDSRVESLASFQKSALLHAFKFPNVKRIAYSTCSVHIKENEEVVVSVLKEAQEKYGFTLVKALPQWPRRGVSSLLDYFDDDIEYSDDELKRVCDAVVRTDPFEDDTDGFFVAVFERK